MASPFSGRAGRLAGMWAADQAQNILNSQNQLLGQAKTDAIGALETGKAGALTTLGQNYDIAKTALNDNYAGAIDRLNPWVTAGQGALGTYQGAIGLGSAADRQAATSAFQNSPGYQYAVDQATDALARKASTMGALGSGNTAAAIADRAQNMQNQKYNSWLDRVNGVNAQGQQAATTQAGLQSSLGNNLSQLSQSQGRDTAGVYTGTGSQLAGTYTGLAGLGSGVLANYGDTLIGAGTGALMAGQQAAQNRLNFGTSLLGLGSSLLGGYLGKRAA